MYGDDMTKKSLKLSGYQHLLDISIQLSREENTDIIMEKILFSALDVSNADAGSIYLVNADNNLEFRTVVNKSMGMHLGGSSEQVIPFPDIPLFIDDVPNNSAIVVHSVNNRDVINIEDVYEELPFDFSAARDMDKKTGYRTKSMLTFPLEDHANNIIGVIQLLNATKNDEIIAFSKEIEHIILSFASLGAIALTNKALITNMEQLFESFAKTIAGAIDDKSPHLGGHCERVPELTLMIADAVHLESEGPLAEFTLSASERHQLNMAGWLHDCGKIGTPDHIIDKATKLETVFDRINFVNAKVEIVRRDIDLKYQDELILALKSNDNSSIKTIEKARDDAQKQLDIDMRFLQNTNVGGEFLTDEQEENIHIISKRYQIIINNEPQSLLSTNEIENLSIKRGTLNDEERKTIQRHMDMTLKILEALPFPAHLSNVAEYALGHHETLDGKGYPRGLTKEQMSVPARLMAIADIFEALSAADRPYKEAKPVSECLKIMGTMVTKNHLDGDIFTTFVRAKVYEKYINKFSSPEQLDDFDINQIPGLIDYSEE